MTTTPLVHAIRATSASARYLADARAVERGPSGKVEAIRIRIEQHRQAGADHVCVKAVSRSGLPDERLLAQLAPQP